MSNVGYASFFIKYKCTHTCISACIITFLIILYIIEYTCVCRGVHAYIHAIMCVWGMWIIQNNYAIFQRCG